VLAATVAAHTVVTPVTDEIDRVDRVERRAPGAGPRRATASLTVVITAPAKVIRSNPLWCRPRPGVHGARSLGSTRGTTKLSEPMVKLVIVS
jgi:hypothetical protein